MGSAKSVSMSASIYADYYNGPSGVTDSTTDSYGRNLISGSYSMSMTETNYSWTNCAWPGGSYYNNFFTSWFNSWTASADGSTITAQGATEHPLASVEASTSCTSLENIPPEVSITSVSIDVSDITVNWSYSDGDGDAQYSWEVQFYHVENDTTYTNSGTQSGTRSTTRYNCPDGTWDITVVVSDEYDEDSDNSDGHLVDITDPEITLHTLSATDPFSVLASVTVTDNVQLKNIRTYLTNYLEEIVTGTDSGTVPISGTTHSTYPSYSSLDPNTKYAHNCIVNDEADNEASDTTGWVYTYANIPSNLNVSNVSASSMLYVTWNANGNPSGTRYYVERRTGGGNWSTVSTTNTYRTLSGLQTNTEYEVRVRARNEADVYTNYTSSAYKYTVANVPASLSVSSVSNSSKLYVTWSANGNPSYTRYYVESRVGTETWSIVNTTDTEITLENLNANTNYEVRVRARNEENVYTSYTASVYRYTSSSIVSNLQASGGYSEGYYMQVTYSIPAHATHVRVTMYEEGTITVVYQTTTTSSSVTATEANGIGSGSAYDILVETLNGDDPVYYNGTSSLDVGTPYRPYLTWEPPETTETIAQYKVWRKTNPQSDVYSFVDSVSPVPGTQNYTDHVDFGTYYYIVTVLDDENPPNESDPSNEVNITI